MYEELNDRQLEAVKHTQGPLLILAGAGSGKTKVLTTRISYLIEHGVSPYNILAITFTNKAADEMRQRVDDAVGLDAQQIWVSTFHSTCARILRRFIDRIGYQNNFTIYDADDQKTLIKSICKKLNIDTKITKERIFLSAISSAKNMLIAFEEFARDNMGDFVGEKKAAVYREYESALKSNNALDFDDLIVKCVMLLKTDKEVRDYYQNRFQYVLVDEYQDTNGAQFELVRLLAGGSNNLCVVGDDDQSIYKFRGANIENILSFEKHYPDAHVVRLEQNYRSTQNILDAANSVIKNNYGRKSKTLWTENEKGDKINFNQYETGEEEAYNIAKDILLNVKEGNATYGQCAVLYRTNAQSRLFEERFMKEGIPYKLIGGVNFYARKEVKDLLCYLKTIDNALDDLAILRIINVPRRGIGATSIAKVQRFADDNGYGLYEALSRFNEIPSLGRTASKIESFVLFIQAMRVKMQYMSVKEIIEEIIEITGYVRELEADGSDEALARIENVDELISTVATYEEESDEPTLSGFLEQVSLVADIDDLDEDEDHVVLMTLHSAKGLEFENVYMVGLEDGLFPSFMCITSDDSSEIEEERRLMYVGITRAMKRLSISAARVRMLRGEMNYNRVSRFVKEIDKKLLKGDVPKSQTRSYVQASAKATKTFKQQSYFNTVNAQKSQKDRNFGANAAASGNLEYVVGDRVRHQKFGEGLVTNIVSGGRDYEVTVDFDSYGTKKMFAVFAKLKKV